MAFRFVIARRPEADVAISGRHLQFVQAAVKMVRTDCVCSGAQRAPCTLAIFAAHILRRKVPKFVIARPQRGRGALSAKREEVPLGCNLGKAAAISPMVFLLFGMCREIATSASGLLAMTNLGALRQKQCSACCKPPWRSPSAPKNTEAAPLLRRLPTISGEIDKGQSSAWKFCPLHAAFPQRPGCPLPFGRVAHGRNK